MARSTAVSRRSTRASSRGNANASSSTATASAPTGASRRRSSTASSSSSASSNNDTAASSRRQRNRRKASEALDTSNEDQDCRKPAAAVSSTTKVTAAASTKPPAAKRPRRSPRLQVTTSVASSAVKNKPTGISSNQVTPSPASHPLGGSSFTFASPLPKRNLKDDHVSDLPKGVVDLYPRVESQVKCSCSTEHCSSAAVTASFLRSYGVDYANHIKNREEPAIPPSLSSAADYSTGFASSPARSNSSQSSAATPGRRDWAYVRMDAIKKVEMPDESTKYLSFQPDLTPKMRAILVDWIIELSEHFLFSTTTLHLAITLVDKVMACGKLSLDEGSDDEDDSDSDDDDSKTKNFLIPRERYQLLGATCTWIACKIEEMKPPTVKDFAYVSDNIYTTTQIQRMERRICLALKFSFCVPTPYPHMYELLRASSECTNPACAPSRLMKNMSNYMLELGRLPYGPVTRKPSLLAAAAIYLARVTLSGDTTWTPTLEYYSGYRKSDLKETVEEIYCYHVSAEECNLKSTFNKFRSKKYDRVAYKTVPLRENLGF